MYNSAGQVIKHQRRNGYYEYAEYDPTGLLTKLWNPTAKASKDQLTAGDPFTSFSYYTTGPWKDRVQTVTDPLGYRATYEYDVDANGAAVYGRGLVTKISYPDDTHNGTIPGGTSQSISYDSWGNKLTEADEMNHATIHIYDDYSRLLTTKLPPTPEVPTAITTYDYTPTAGGSPFSHTTKSWTTMTGPTGIQTGQTFDNNFRVLTRTEAKQDPAISATTSYIYDNNGNPTTVTDPRGKFTTNIYDQRNRKSDSTGPAPFYQTTHWQDR